VLKTLGYLVSIVSVFLLGAVAWKSASEHPTLLLALICGMGTSILGMFLRWLSFLNEQKQKRGR
jgi:hypothetical protein